VWVVLALSALLPLLSVGSARADDEADQARAYHEKAKAAFALSHYAQAAEFFEKAFELKSDPALLYNAAQSHRLAGNKERALTLYQNYLHVYGRDDRRAQIETRISELKKAIDRDRTEVPAPPPSNWPPGTKPPPGTGAAATSPPFEPIKPAPPAGRPRAAAPVVVAPAPVTPPPPALPPPVVPPPAAPPAGASPPVLLSQNGGLRQEEDEKSLTHKTWFWVAVGGGVAAAAVVVLMVALGGSKDPSASLGQAHGN
jgi:tetratricopeptide (TPR) repeat protein